MARFWWYFRRPNMKAIVPDKFLSVPLVSHPEINTRPPRYGSPSTMKEAKQDEIWHNVCTLDSYCVRFYLHDQEVIRFHSNQQYFKVTKKSNRRLELKPITEEEAELIWLASGGILS